MSELSHYSKKKERQKRFLKAVMKELEPSINWNCLVKLKTTKLASLSIILNELNMVKSVPITKNSKTRTLYIDRILLEELYDRIKSEKDFANYL